MAYYGGLQGVPSGLTKSNDHPSQMPSAGLLPHAMLRGWRIAFGVGRPPYSNSLASTARWSWLHIRAKLKSSTRGPHETHKPANAQARLPTSCCRIFEVSDTIAFYSYTGTWDHK